MKLYLSSYRVGAFPEKLKELVGKEGAKVAVCVNALDAAKNSFREEVLSRELEDMTNLGFEAEELDLRLYFEKSDELLDKLKACDAIWLSGGNVFILAKAFKQSNFNVVIDQLIKTGDLVYAGYSAAFCILTSSLHGVELVDDKDAEAPGYESGEIWEGVGLIDFYPIVHFRSDHHESDLVEKEYEYVVRENINHKTFKDGDIYLVNGVEEQTLTV